MTVMQTTQPQYIPGVCNIGPAEIVRRKRLGFASLGVALLYAGTALLLHFSPLAGLLLFFPATISALGLLQAYMHFCVKFGMRGLFNVSESLLRTESVEQAKWREKDKHKAMIIIALGILTGSLSTIFLCLMLS